MNIGKEERKKETRERRKKGRRERGKGNNKTDDMSGIQKS